MNFIIEYAKTLVFVRKQQSFDGKKSLRSTSAEIISPFLFRSLRVYGLRQ